MTEWILIALSAIDLMLVIALFYIGQKASKIDSLEGSLEAKAGELVKAEFRVNSAEFKVITGELGALVRQMQRRLDAGDEKFDKQGETQQKLELRMLEKFATREALDDMAERVRELETKLARFEEHCRGKHEVQRN